MHYVQLMNTHQHLVAGKWRNWFIKKPVECKPVSLAQTVEEIKCRQLVMGVSLLSFHESAGAYGL